MRSLARQLLSVALSLFAALSSAPTRAQYASDIDIFSVASTAADTPNVLIVLDNTANWSSMFSREMKALTDTLSALQSDRFRVGLMMFTETGTNNSGPDGAYVRAAVRPLTDTYKGRLINLVNSLDTQGDRSNNGKAGLAMAEAYRYFSGQAPVSGVRKDKTDYAGNTSGTAASQAIYALPGNALSSYAGSSYASPVQSGCVRNYIIYVSNGAAQDNASDSAAASGALTAAYNALGMTRPPDISGLSPSGSQDNMADEWARLMRASPQAISTYTLDIDPRTTGQGPDWSALLASMATRSGGDYFRIDSTVNNGAQIADALTRVFTQIQAANAIFAAPSLPASLNARGTYDNQVFMGVFRPDGDARPRWRGNLKQYRFAYDPVGGTLKLVDALGYDVVSAASGFIQPMAQSFWTTPSNFWVNQTLGTPPSASDMPDGDIVEKGGTAQRQRTTFATSRTARRLFTCLGCAAQPASSIDLTGSAYQFTTSNANLTAATLGVATSADRTALIEWVRGADNAGDEAGPADGVTTVRPSLHGDVLHSRPVAINFGGTTGVVVFYGSNDGLLRAINGNVSGTGAGEELWGFIPSEHLGRLQRLRKNAPEIRLSTTSVPASVSNPPTPRDYFVDGPIGFYQRLAADGSSQQVILFVGMRRGGRQVYALDVTQPSSPRYLWKRTDADLPILGQTWSEPRAARLQGYSNPVVIMGAGYDNVAEDAATPGTTTMGNAILVLDALTGGLVKSFSTLRSVAADVSLVDSDYDGFTDRAYAADVGGNVYRIDFETQTSSGMTTSSTAWGMFRLAALGGTGIPVRKFFYPPDVVLAKGFTAVQVGSGDREKPLSASSNDAFFTLYDTRTTKGTPTGTVTPLAPADLGQVGTSQSMVRGCYIPMDGSTGEKVVNAATTVAGITYFSSSRPPRASTNACSASFGGVATAYAVPVFCQAPTTAEVRGGGLPPSVVAGTTLVRYVDPATGQSTERLVNFRIGGPNAKGSSIDVTSVSSPVVSSRKRRYWFNENAR